MTHCPPPRYARAFRHDPDAFDRRHELRRREDQRARVGVPVSVLLAAGFAGGVALGGLAWEAYLSGNRRELFSASPVRRFAAVSYLGGRPSVDTARLLRDYVRWERHPLLRRRARRVLRTLEAAL